MKNKYTNKYILETGIGLQDVDRLDNSSYFKNEANRYLKGEISLEELDTIITSYYENKSDSNGRYEEADKISIRIAKIISDDYFTFSVGQLLSMHKTLFDGVFEHAGKIREYNFSKKEWVLDGASVLYGDYRELESTLQYDFNQEKNFKYEGLSVNEVIEHLALFVANLWQIHVFEEGNTRTTAVFFIKYLRKLGFDVTNDTFAKNAWYFRNSLVRANYTNVSKGIYEDRSYLIKFLRNLLLGEKNELLNRELHIQVNGKESCLTREERILNFINDNNEITLAEIAQKLNVSLRTVKSIIKVMKDKNQIKRINGKKYGCWQVTNGKSNKL